MAEMNNQTTPTDDPTAGKDNGGASSEKDDPTKTTANASDNSDKGSGDDPIDWETVFKHPRFKALNEQNQELKTKVEKMEAAASDAETKKLKADQKWQQLAEKSETQVTKLKQTVKDLKKEIAAYEAVTQGQLEKQLETMPEALANLLKPLLEGKTAAQKLAILAENSDSLTALAMQPNGEGENQGTPRGIPPTPPAGSNEAAMREQAQNYRKNYRSRLRGYS